MSEQPDLDPFVDEEIASPSQSNAPKEEAAASQREMTPNEHRRENLRNTFGQGPGLIALIAVGVIVVVFLALAFRGFSKAGEQAVGNSNVQQPNIPERRTDVQVSPEEMARRQQIAAEEAERAAQSGQFYQPGFDMQVAASQPQFGQEGEFRLGLPEQQAQGQVYGPTVASASSVQLTSEQEAEILRLEEQRKATEAERQRLLSEYNQRVQKRDEFANTQRDVVMAQIDNVFKGAGSNGMYTTVPYLPMSASGVPNYGNQQQNYGAYQQEQPPSTGGIAQPAGNSSSRGCEKAFRTGNTAFAVLDHEVNTDADNHAIATIMGGPYNGSKVIGGVQISHNNVALQFNRLAPQDGRNTLAINAVAMRTSDASMGVATSINRHTISRYTALIFSSGLAGLANAAQQTEGTMTQLNNGTTVVSTERANDRQIIGNVLGQVGQTMSGEIAQRISRPPTYKVARGTGVALFFMDDVCVQ